MAADTFKENGTVTLHEHIVNCLVHLKHVICVKCEYTLSGNNNLLSLRQGKTLLTSQKLNNSILKLNFWPAMQD